jgi:hypothetical protein
VARSLVLLTLVALAVAAAPAAAAPSSNPCQRGKTIAKNGHARVFKVVAGDDTRLYACLLGERKRVLLGVATDDGYVTFEKIRLVRLTGRFVAWDFESTDLSCKADCPPEYDTTREHASVYDLRRRQRRRLHEIAPRRLELTRTGVLAWTSGADGDVSVFKSAATGDRTLLDEGNVRASSLRVQGLRASWVKDGVRTSVRIG